MVRTSLSVFDLQVTDADETAPWPRSESTCGAILGLTFTAGWSSFQRDLAQLLFKVQRSPGAAFQEKLHSKLCAYQKRPLKVVTWWLDAAPPMHFIHTTFGDRVTHLQPTSATSVSYNFTPQLSAVL